MTVFYWWKRKKLDTLSDNMLKWNYTKGTSAMTKLLGRSTWGSAVLSTSISCFQLKQLKAQLQTRRRQSNQQAAKGRPSDNPLIVHIADANQIYDYMMDDDGKDTTIEKLAANSWPGPLTLVVPVKKIFSCCGNWWHGNSRHTLARPGIDAELIRKLFPIVGPQQIFLKAQSTSVDHAWAWFWWRDWWNHQRWTYRIGESTVLDLTDERGLIPCDLDTSPNQFTEVPDVPELRGKIANDATEAPSTRDEIYSL